MAASKILSFRQVFVTPSTFWNAPQRNFAKERTILKKMGFPEKPKKPPSGYLAFVSVRRAGVMEQNPNKTFGEISKVLHKQWIELPEGEKQRYTDTYKKQLTEYKAKMEDYNNLFSEAQKKEIKQLVSVHQASQKERLIVNELKKLEKQLNKPKSPVSPFFIYYIKNADKFKTTNARDKLKQIGEHWRNASESEKQKYKALFEKENEQYKKDLEKWEEQMMQEGKLDLIRLKTLKKKLQGTVKQ